MNNHKWTEDIDRKMNDFEMSPPDGLWECIEKSLVKSVGYKKPTLPVDGRLQMTSSRMPHFALRINARKAIRWSAAAVLAGVVVSGIGLLWTYSPLTTDVARQEAAPLAHGHSSANGASDGNAARPNKFMALADKPARQAHIQSLQAGIPPQSIDSAASTSDETATAPASQANAAKADSATMSRTKNPRQAHEGNTHVPSGWASWPLIAESRHEPHHRFSASVIASNFLNSSNVQSGYGELVVGTIWNDDSNYGTEEAPEENSAVGDIIIGNHNRDVYTKKKHRQPIKVGLSVNYHLTDRLSIESGLCYSYLSSELFSGTDDYNYTTKQSLQYIGIPLNISYTVFRGKRWNVYGTGGGMVEKCVKGSSTTDYIVKGQTESTQHDDVTEHRLQYSVNAAVGLQVMATENVGVYLEPGLSYHFNNHSTVTNIYKDTPFNFNLGIGVRYSF